MMGVADSLERAADLIAQGGIGLAPALSEVAKTSRAFIHAKDALLRTTRFVTLGDYVALRGRNRQTVIEDLRKAAKLARGEMRL
jgi:hypothetical protein